MPPYGSRTKLWWGPGSNIPRSPKELLLWNRLPLIKIYTPQPVMKVIQHIFFSKILPKSKLQVNFSVRYFNLWRQCAFANYLSLCILLKIYWTKKLFWASSSGAKPVYWLLNPAGYVYGVLLHAGECWALWRSYIQCLLRNEWAMLCWMFRVKADEQVSMYNM